jgi:hypothetical protein
MRRLIRFIDWRLVLAVAFLLLVAAVVQSSLDAASDRDRLAAEVIHKDRVSAAEREEASAERARILEGQQDLEGKYDRLITWLNAQGIVVPDEVLNDTRRSSDDHNDNSDGNGGGSGSTPAQKGSGKQSLPKSGANRNPVTTAPRGSGKGHRAGSGHHKGHRKAAAKGGPHGQGKDHREAKSRHHGKGKGH